MQNGEASGSGSDDGMSQDLSHRTLLDMFVDTSDEEGGPVTMANMERKARALDLQNEEDARLDLEELQNAAMEEEDDDDDMDEDFGFALPTVDEREAEQKSGGPDLASVQRRIQGCARVLSNFKKRAAPGRWVVHILFVLCLS